ncbi:MFS transporter [Phaeobacter gallaeciensis]|uniref:MFS transporter n=2 Tax=Roseobacteraceae TaxID=2854170 RepID=A0A366WVI0_9RHOB|nr:MULTISPECIES: MFS transporter [Roseobacteraceae]MBT3140831.1 MFS transporter [Falsiruegeria litorea]MBT8170575.1 MFS transporter [Falsiruegeria litorea]RBW52781.1 MFS transporter [Phaeobacter gallaeciensis]
MWAPILILLSSIGIIGANSLLLAPIVSAVGQTLGVPAAQVMHAASAYGLGTAFAALTLAPLSDRYGAGRMLRLALIGLALGLAASAWAPTLIALIVAQALCGVASGIALPAIYALPASIAPAGREAQVTGAVLTGWTVSLVLGVSVSAYATDLVGWRAVYAVLTAAAALLWVLSSPLRTMGVGSGRLTSPLSALRVPGLRRALTAVSLIMTAFYTSYFFMGIHVTEVLHGTSAMAGAISLSYGIGFGLAVLVDPFLDRVGLARATAPLFAMVAVSYGLMGLASPSYLGLVGFAFLWGIGQHLALNLVVARLTALDPIQRGAIMGLNSTVTYLCVFLSPFIGSVLFSQFGLIGCLTASAFLCLIEAVEALSLRRSVTSGSPVVQP